MLSSIPPQVMPMTDRIIELVITTFWLVGPTYLQTYKVHHAAIGTSHFLCSEERRKERKKYRI